MGIYGYVCVYMKVCGKVFGRLSPKNFVSLDQVGQNPTLSIAKKTTGQVPCFRPACLKRPFISV